MMTRFLVKQTVPRSGVSAGGGDTDENNSSGSGGRAACRYVTIPPEHVTRCDQADVTDDNGVSGV